MHHLLRMLTVAGVALGGVYLLIHYFNIYSLLISMATFIWVIYIVEQNPEDRLLLRKRAVLVTGCDTGFGNRLVRYLDTIGLIVFAGCLNPDSDDSKQLQTDTGDNVHVLKLDVTSSEDVASAKRYITNILEEDGLVLWSVVNNAGVFTYLDAELTSVDQYKLLCDVNYLGTVRVTNAFLPLLRKCEGRAILVSSVMGQSAATQCAAYTGSKRAIEGYADCLREEMHRFGVNVCLIEPGNFAGSTGLMKTDRFRRIYTDLRDHIDAEVYDVYGEDYVMSIYNEIYDERRKPKLPDMMRVVHAIDHALFSVKPKTRYRVHGGIHPVEMSVIATYLYSWLPTTWYDWLVRKQLNKYKTPAALIDSVSSAAM